MVVVGVMVVGLELVTVGLMRMLDKGLDLGVMMVVVMMMWSSWMLLRLLLWWWWLMVMMVVRGMCTGRATSSGRNPRRAVRVVRTGLSNGEIALHRGCTVVILKVGVIDVMMPVIFTLHVSRCRTTGRAADRSSRNWNRGTRTRRAGIVGQAF